MKIVDTIRSNIECLVEQQAALHFQAKCALKSGHTNTENILRELFNLKQ